MYPRHLPLFTVRGFEDRGVRLRVGEEKRQGEHFEDGGGMPNMSVSIEHKLAQRKDMTVFQTSLLLHA